MKKERKPSVSPPSQKPIREKAKPGSPVQQVEYQAMADELRDCKAELEQKKEELRSLQRQFEKGWQHETPGNPGFFNSLPSANFILTPEGIISEVNLLGARLLRSDPAALSNVDFTTFVSEETRLVFLRFLEEAFSGIARASCALTLNILNDQPLFVHIKGILSEDQKLCNMVVCDAFNRQLETALLESELKYKRFHDSISDGFVYVEMDGRIKEYNEAFQQMLGYSGEELPQLTYRDITPEKWHAFEQHIVEDQVLVNGYSDVYEKEYKRKDGTPFPVELRTVLIKNEAGENEGMWAFIRDITTRKKKDQQILENEYWLKESQRIGRLGSYTLDIVSGKYNSTPALDAILGIYKDSEKNLETWSKLVVPEQREELVNFFYNNLTKNGPLQEMEYEIIRPVDNKRCWVWSTGDLSFDAAGKPAQIFGIIQDITERKKREEQLIENNYWLRESQRIGRLGFYSLDLLTNEYTSTEVLDSILGLDENSEKKLETWQRVVAPEYLQEITDYFNYNVVQKGEPFEKEYQIIRLNDNERRWVWSTGEVNYDSEGKPVKAFGTIQDITPQKRMDEQLIENEYWLKESQRIGRLGSYSMNVNDHNYQCSEALDTIFGIDKNSEKTTENWINLIVPEERAEMMDYLLNHVVQKKQTFDKEYHIIRRNDKEIRCLWGFGELTFDAEGNPLRMFGVVQDITERKKAEEALHHSEREHRDTLNSLPDWIFVVDENLQLITVNKSFEEEYSRLGIPLVGIGEKISVNIPFISASIMEAIEHVFQCATGLVMIEKIDLGGKAIYAEIRIIPFLKNQKVDKVITLIRDKSREKEIEELKLRNLEQKEVLLREIHHRVKNNLSIVISLLNFQLRKHTDPLLNRIIQDIQMRIRSMALIHEHLYFSENLDRIPLASYIRSLITFISSSFKLQNIRLETKLDSLDVRIETALPLGLIINELLTNSYKYAFPVSGEGLIQIQLIHKEDEQVTLIFNDNGIGLPESASMESEKSLGLFIVRLLVEQLEGSIEIIRQNGTAFIVRFKNRMLY